ncbi:hypothetical protein H7H51_07430 [Mycolicibacterium farcinogenes]|nr:hypothetical protein [Mycolicibacterium farcinogenes]
MAATDGFLTLDAFLRLIGGGFIDVVHAPVGLDLPVSAALIYDVGIAVPVNAGDLVLAIGMPVGSAEAERLVATVDGHASVAFKIRDDAERERLLLLCKSHAITGLAISPEMSWDQLYTLARTSIASASAAVTDHHGVRFGDLFALANSAAVMLEGPVIIDDDRIEVIAFSSLDDPIDSLREQSILQRRPPREFLEWCEQSGVLPRVRQSLNPVKVVPPDGANRLVTAIRGGVDILGYLWVAESKRKLDQHSADLLAEIARVAAVHLLRSRISDDLDRRMRSEQLRSALTGGGNLKLAQTRLGLDNTAFRLVAFAPGLSGAISPGPPDPLGLLSLEDLVALRVDVANRRSIVTACGGRVYAVFPTHDDTTSAESAKLAEDIVGQASRQLHLDIRAAVSGEMDAVDQLAESRAAVDRLLNMPLLDQSRRVVTFDDAVSHVILSELDRVHDQPPSPPARRGSRNGRQRPHQRNGVPDNPAGILRSRW